MDVLLWNVKMKALTAKKRCCLFLSVFLTSHIGVTHALIFHTALCWSPCFHHLHLKNDSGGFDLTCNTKQEPVFLHSGVLDILVGALWVVTYLIYCFQFWIYLHSRVIIKAILNQFRHSSWSHSLQFTSKQDGKQRLRLLLWSVKVIRHCEWEAGRPVLQN